MLLQIFILAIFFLNKLNYNNIRILRNNINILYKNMKNKLLKIFSILNIKFFFNIIYFFNYLKVK